MSEYVFYTTKQDKFKPSPFYINDQKSIDNFVNQNKHKDTYKTINHFQEPTSWKKDNIGTLVALVIDVEATGHAFDITLEDAEQLLRHIKKEFENTMPTPSKVIHSGRGLHIYFDIENSTDLQKYQIVLKRLQKLCDEVIGRYDALSEARADTSVNYFSLIRVEGTLNTSSNTYSQRIYESKARYTLDNLIERYITDLSDIIGEGLKQRAKTSKVHRTELKTFKREFKPYRKGFTAKTLQAAVLSDLEKLQELRASTIIRNNGKYIDKGHEGYRNLMLFIYAVYSKYYHEDTNAAYKALKCFNARFKPQPLDEDELSAVFVSSLKSNYITQKTSVMAKSLELDPNEMKLMKVLFDKEEQKQRQREREIEYNKKRLEVRQESKNELIAQCKSLKEQGYTQRKIAQELKISLGSVNKYLCQ
jgi:hypothetical protein